MKAAKCMKAIADMNLQELAAYVASYLQQCGIPVVLVGGACVSIYCDNKYQTSDLDFVEKYHTQRLQLKRALLNIDFIEQHRYFVHPQAQYFLEFPTGPLAIGDSPVNQLHEVKTETGVLTLLSAQDCIRDRLTAYYHWRDKQSLQQAVWVALDNVVDMAYIQQWSLEEGMAEKFECFLEALAQARLNTDS